MKSLIVAITILAWVGMIAGMAALAADEGTVTATVSAQQVSINIEDGNVTYGSIALSGTEDTLALGETQHAGNNGNTAEKFNIMGTDSADWVLADATPTGDQYMHRFATDGGTIWSPLATDGVGYQTLVASIAGGSTATQDFDLEVMMSDDTTISASQDVNVYLQATTP